MSKNTLIRVGAGIAFVMLWASGVFTLAGTIGDKTISIGLFVGLLAAVLVLPE